MSELLVILGRWTPIIRYVLQPGTRPFLEHTLHIVAFQLLALHHVALLLFALDQLLSVV